MFEIYFLKFPLFLSVDSDVYFQPTIFRKFPYMMFSLFFYIKREKWDVSLHLNTLRYESQMWSWYIWNDPYPFCPLWTVKLSSVWNL